MNKPNIKGGVEKGLRKNEQFSQLALNLSGKIGV